MNQVQKLQNEKKALEQQMEVSIACDYLRTVTSSVIPIINNLFT